MGIQIDIKNNVKLLSQIFLIIYLSAACVQIIFKNGKLSRSLHI
jgi:hypothetical protein